MHEFSENYGFSGELLEGSPVDHCCGWMGDNARWVDI